MLEYLIKTIYLPLKNHNSRKTHWYTPKQTLPVLGFSNNGNPEKLLIESINDQLGKLKYTADPLSGAYDFYNPAEFTQWQLNNNNFDFPCDCDDFAAYGYGLARKSGVSKDRVTMSTLIVNWQSLFSKMWANHVILLLHLTEGNGREWTACLDTNSAARKKVFWVQGKPLDQQTRKNIMELFGNIYRVNYGALIDSEYPFDLSN
jgi:hypothetical protein